MAPILIVTLAAALAAALPDRGIWPDLDGGVAIAPPPWRQAGAEAWLRLDDTHRVLTLYQDGAALMAYPLREGGEARTLREVLPLLRETDANELRALVPEGVRVEHGAPTRAEDHDGDGVVDSLDILLGAKKLVQNGAAYKEAYRGLRYPGGDVPRDEGVCTDTLVRALRNAGWDLQREIHEELRRDPRPYPLAKGKRPDSNIDHRRVRMVLPWLARHFTLVPASAPLWPGDILLLDTFPSKSGPDHIGIVSDRLGPSGRPLLVNNWTVGYHEQEMDLLPAVPITHRFRAPRPDPRGASARRGGAAAPARPPR